MGFVAADTDTVVLLDGSVPLRTEVDGDRLWSYDWASMDPGTALFPFRNGATLPDQSAREDPVGIGTGGPILTSLSAEGDFETNYPDVTTGWRGLLAIESGHARVVVTTYTDLSVTGTPHGGSGMVAYTNNATRLALSNWLNPFGFLEQGPIGLDALDFGYTFLEDGEFVGGEMCFLGAAFAPPAWILPPDGQLSALRLYVADDLDGVWWAWTSVNGWLCDGPIRVPAALCGSTVHGIQLDVGPTAPGITYSNLAATACDRFTGDVPAEYDPPVFTAAAAVTSTGATSTPVPMASLSVGDRAFLIGTITSATAVTDPAGWTRAQTLSVTGLNGRLWYRDVAEGDTWHQAATVTLSHVAARLDAHMVGLSNCNPYRPHGLGTLTDTGTDTAATVPAVTFAGPRRASWSWLATVAASTQAWAGIWVETQALPTLVHGLVAEWPGTEMTDSGGPGHQPTTGTTAVTLGTGTRSIAFHIQANPLPFRRDPDWPDDIPTRYSGDTPWRT